MKEKMAKLIKLAYATITALVVIDSFIKAIINLFLG